MFILYMKLNASEQKILHLHLQKRLKTLKIESLSTLFCLRAKLRGFGELKSTLMRGGMLKNFVSELEGGACRKKLAASGRGGPCRNF